MFYYNFNSHEYLVSSSNCPSVKEKVFLTRNDAESYMHKVCNRLGLKNVVCIERDKHERLYQTDEGVFFCVNRI